MPSSNPPAAGTPSFLEGLALESVIDLVSNPPAQSIPSAQSSSEDTEETESEAPKKRARTRNDLEDVTSAPEDSSRQTSTRYPMPSAPVSNFAQQPNTNNPIRVVPLSSAPPTTSGPPRLYGLSK